MYPMIVERNGFDSNEQQCVEYATAEKFCGQGIKC